ncbi:MAG: hypothetical protein J3R72DRAFT_515582 [Linnemannia gamsii]|nr:MAG: hypothetical protein J3R72DRAFT_515582 [Linnemannia gamsii]
MVHHLLPAQADLVEIFKNHKKEIQCPKCLHIGRFQRDGFKDGKMRFTCSTPVTTTTTRMRGRRTTDKSKPSKCNKHFSESTMEQLLLQVVAKQNRKEKRKKGSVGTRKPTLSAIHDETPVDGNDNSNNNNIVGIPGMILKEETFSGGGGGGDVDVLVFALTEELLQDWVESQSSGLEYSSVRTGSGLRDGLQPTQVRRVRFSHSEPKQQVLLHLDLGLLGIQSQSPMLWSSITRTVVATVTIVTFRAREEQLELEALEDIPCRSSLDLELRFRKPCCPIDFLMGQIQASIISSTGSNMVTHLVYERDDLSRMQREPDCRRMYTADNIGSVSNLPSTTIFKTV